MIHKFSTNQSMTNIPTLYKTPPPLQILVDIIYKVFHARIVKPFIPPSQARRKPNKLIKNLSIMNLKTYLQQLEETKPSNSIELNPALIERFKNQVAVLPTPMKVGDEMTVVDFKGENPQQLQVVCALGEEEVKEIKYTQLVRASQTGDITPDDILCDPTIKQKHGDKLRFIYSLAKNMMLDQLILTLKGKTIVLCGQVETPAVYGGSKTKMWVKKFAYLEE